jgi:hypothetical protein
MDFHVLTNFNWRDALIVIVALLAIYVLVVFLRMRHLKHEKEGVSAVAQSAVAAYATEREPERPPERRAEPDFAWNEAPPEIPGQQMIDHLEREVMHLRSEVGQLRAELSEVRNELRRGELMPEPSAQNINDPKNEQNAAPVYSDAMQMAMLGHDAQTISEKCGVARAEAELVVTLVRSR